jgi:hypothetical protein
MTNQILSTAPIFDLPIEILSLILSYLPLKSFIDVAMTCCHFYNLLIDDFFMTKLDKTFNLYIKQYFTMLKYDRCTFNDGLFFLPSKNLSIENAPNYSTYTSKMILFTYKFFGDSKYRQTVSQIRPIFSHCIRDKKFAKLLFYRTGMIKLSHDYFNWFGNNVEGKPDYFQVFTKLKNGIFKISIRSTLNDGFQPVGLPERFIPLTVGEFANFEFDAQVLSTPEHFFRLYDFSRRLLYCDYRNDNKQRFDSKMNYFRIVPFNIDNIDAIAKPFFLKIQHFSKMFTRMINIYSKSYDEVEKMGLDYEYPDELANILEFKYKTEYHDFYSDKGHLIMDEPDNDYYFQNYGSDEDYD